MPVFTGDHQASDGTYRSQSCHMDFKWLMRAMSGAKSVPYRDHVKPYKRRPDEYWYCTPSPRLTLVRPPKVAMLAPAAGPRVPAIPEAFYTTQPGIESPGALGMAIYGTIIYRYVAYSTLRFSDRSFMKRVP